MYRCWGADQAAANPARRRRSTAPIPPKPTSIRAQEVGSGTAVVKVIEPSLKPSFAEVPTSAPTNHVSEKGVPLSTTRGPDADVPATLKDVN